MRLYRYTFTAKGSTQGINKVVAKGEVWDEAGYPDSVWDKVSEAVKSLMPDFEWPRDGIVTTGPSIYQTKKWKEVGLK